MVKVTSGNHCFYLDGYLKSNLDGLKENAKKDYDAFVVVDGREGFGKSTLAMQCAKYLDPTFNLSRVVFNTEQFKEAVESAKKYQAIVFDEAFASLNSRQTISKINRTLVGMFTEMRFRNLFVFLCLPSIFDLDKYPAMFRSQGLIHVYKRARFGGYNYDGKKNLYINGKKFYSYYKPSPDFFGVFTKAFPLDEGHDKYNKKKLEASKHTKAMTDKDTKVLEQRNKLINYVLANNNLKVEDLASEINLTPQMVYKIIKEGKLN